MADPLSPGRKGLTLFWFCALWPPALPCSGEGQSRRGDSDSSHINLSSSFDSLVALNTQIFVTLKGASAVTLQHREWQDGSGLLPYSSSQPATFLNKPQAQTLPYLGISRNTLSPLHTNEFRSEIEFISPVCS